jgi:hypothetical protein
MKMKKLPIGISALDKIIGNDYIYVDKTKHIVNLVKSGGEYYFLSRPRRFGKSLLVDTLKQAFLGKHELFTGLYLENHWDWEVEYPIVHIDLGQGIVQSRVQLDAVLTAILDRHYIQYNIENIYQEASIRFRYLIDSLAEKFNLPVVILVDEYDKPILDNITDAEHAGEIRDGLKSLYSVIKTVDSKLRFVLLTGVSKFSKVSLFSGLNNLSDITLDSRYADICGYTQAELETNFANELVGVDKSELKNWYNGYNFAGSEVQKVYNPFDILLFFDKGKIYRNYWFETATPTFLVKLMESRKYFVPNLENVIISDKNLSGFDVDNINITTLLFQTGYLTIKEIITIGSQYAYSLTYPNLEVKASLNDSLADIGSSMENKTQNLAMLDMKLKQNDIAGLEQVFRSYFASIPHDWYRKNDMANYEGFYASIVYSYFCALGYDLIAEYVTNHGKIDLTLRMPDKILVIEFKLHTDAVNALQQIKDRAYADKYLSDGKPIYLIGVSFDTESRNISDFAYEVL